MDRSDKFINNRQPRRLVLAFLIMIAVSVIFSAFISVKAAGYISKEQLKIYLSAVGGGDILKEPVEEDIVRGESILDFRGIDSNIPPQLVYDYSAIRRRVFIFMLAVTIIPSVIWLLYSMKSLFSVYDDLEELRKECIKAANELGYSIKLKGQGSDCVRRISESAETLVNRMNYLYAEIKNEKTYLRGFLEDFSHQIKTSLAVIRLNTDILAETEDIDEKRREELDSEMQLNLDAMENLVVQAIKLARLDMDTVEYKKENCLLNDTCRRAVKRILPLLRKENIAVSCEMSEDIILMHDRGWLCEAIENILKNSADHSGCTEIKIEISENPISIILAINDNGKGIPQKDIPKLFERFAKKSGDITMKSAGLGMSIAQKIVHGQNGEILVYSTENEGTRFEIVFLK